MTEIFVRLHGPATWGNGAPAKPVPPHISYIGVAAALSESLNLLAESGPEHSYSLALVAGQSVECALKAYLSRNGNVDRLRRKAVRHNLEALWMKATEEGLLLSQPPPRWLSLLSRIFDDPYDLRYSTSKMMVVGPAAEPMVYDVQQLLRLVQQALPKV